MTTVQTDVQTEEKIYFGFSYWGCPYRRQDDEHFIIGPFETSAEARKAVKRKLENGQPNTMRDWVSGPVKIFDTVEKLKKGLDKAKLNVPRDIEANEFYIGETCLWRPTQK